ncbi:hypothetical protein MM236_16235 [Belliella sp. DSM 107340]|uniref:Uncharacterized protein n=1 Tax=Belliella calami TaxID=2923436 RepID=A0ABS9USR7_9BACT|nr:hypothetical protein [Belliella calami]MCH7399553.1 hypothetical protein [Belliella calami]
MKKVMLKSWVLVFVLLFKYEFSLAQDNESNPIIYSQKIDRMENILEVWNANRGTLYLRESTVEFVPKNTNGRGAFELEYEDIISVKRRFSLIFPNRIFIIDKNYSKIKIFTYKRRQIIDIIRSKMEG